MMRNRQWLRWERGNTEKNVLLIVNPNSGDGEAKRWVYDMAEKLLTVYDFVTVYFSKCAGDIARVAREKSADYDAVVCCGGDGTLNETINGLVEANTFPMLGYIPTGTVNDFATSHKIPKGIKGAIDKIITGTAHEYDVGVLGERCFSYVAAFGAFTDVAYLTPQGSKASFGRTAYIAEAAKRLFSLNPIRTTFEYEGKEMTDDLIYGMVTNSKTVGGIRFFEDSSADRLSDGKLEVLLVRFPNNPVQLQEAISGLLTPRITNDFVYKFSTDAITFRFDGNAPWTLDGEFGGDYPEITVRCLPRRIRVIE